MKYILDTNVLSEAVKTKPNRHVMAMLKKHQSEIATASPVWHELQYGCCRLPVSRKREIIESFLEDVIRQNIIIFPYDERSAKWHAQERARLAAKGQMPAYVDGQIAAIAKVNGLALVTRNTADFIIFTDLELQNWYKGV